MPVWSSWVRKSGNYSNSAIIASHYAVARQVADQVLIDVCHNFMFGSSNISKFQYSAHSDNYSIFPGTIEKNHTLEALLDKKIVDIAKLKLRASRKRIDEANASTPHTERSEREYTYLKNRATISEKTGAGNCEELATFAFMQLLHMPDINFSVEYMAFNEPLDHVFLVLNRDYSTGEYDWNTWNSTAIILDPWLGKQYSPSQIRKLWQNHNNGSPSPWLGIDYPSIDKKAWKRTYQCWWGAPLITIKKEFDIDDFKESQCRNMF